MKSGKKIILLLLICINAFSVTAFANKISFKINGEEVDFKNDVFIKDSTVMLPLRETAELGQFAVKWNEGEQKVTLVRGEKWIELQIGNTDVTVDGEKMQTPSAHIIHKNNTYISYPLAKLLLGVVRSSWNEEEGLLEADADDILTGELLGSGSGSGDSGGMKYDFKEFLELVDFEIYTKPNAAYSAPWVLNSTSVYDEKNGWLYLYDIFNRFTTPVLTPGTYTLSFDVKNGDDMEAGKVVEFFIDPTWGNNGWYGLQSVQSKLANLAQFKWEFQPTSRSRYFLQGNTNQKWTTYKFDFTVTEARPVNFYIGSANRHIYLDNVEIKKK